jgi:SPP1 gp7 family putative phage head morphogenesis protein
MASEVSTYMAQWKALLKSGEQQTTEAMAQKYVGLQNALKGQLEKLAGDVIAVQEKGEVPTPGLLNQIDTYKKFQADSAEQYAKYIDWAGDVASEEQVAAAKGATSAASEALNKKPNPLEDTDGLGEEVLAAWDEGAVESMSGMTAGGPLKELLQQGYGVMEQEIAQRLVDGVAKGMNAFEVANNASDALGIGLDRILCIARTEMNRSFRDSTMDAYRSSGVVERYARMSARDELVCEACLAADGDVFDADVEPDDHPNCRCTVVPLIPGEEIADLGLTDSRAWFDTQDEGVQRGIMGPGRLAMYQEAKASAETEATLLWDRMVSRNVDPTWGGTLRITPLKDLSKEIGGLPKDGASTPSHFVPSKDLAPYPGKSAGFLGDLAPNDKLYKEFLETDAGAKAYQAALNHALGIGPAVDEALVADHIATVLAKDYQSSGALDYYLKTKGFNLNAEEKAKVKEAWKTQKSGQKIAAKALAKHEEELAAQKLAAEEAKLKEAAAKEAKAAEQKAMIQTFAKDSLEAEADMASALDTVASYAGGDTVYKEAFHDAFVAKYGMNPKAAEMVLAHEEKMAGALETLLAKDYKSPGAADYWLAHAGAQAFTLSGDDAKELKAKWAVEHKAKKAAEKEAAKVAKAAEPKLNIMDAVKLKNDMLDASTLTMAEKVEAEKAANAAAQVVIDAGGTKAEMMAAVKQVIDTHVEEAKFMAGPAGALTPEAQKLLNGFIMQGGSGDMLMMQAKAAGLDYPQAHALVTAYKESATGGSFAHEDAKAMATEWLKGKGFPLEPTPADLGAAAAKAEAEAKFTAAEKADIDAYVKDLLQQAAEVGTQDVDMLMMVNEEVMANLSGDVLNAIQDKVYAVLNGTDLPTPKAGLYDALSNPAKMTADFLLHEMADAGFSEAGEALAYLKNYAEMEGMTAAHQAAVLEKWATFANVELPAGAKDLTLLTKNEVDFLAEHLAMLLEPMEEMGTDLSAIDVQTAKEAAWAAGAKAMVNDGLTIATDSEAMSIHEVMSNLLHDELAAPVFAGEDAGQAALVQNLVHDMALAGVNSVGAAELYIEGAMPELASTAMNAAVKAMQEAGHIPPDVASLPPLKVAVAKHITMLGEQAAGHDPAAIIAAKEKAILAGKQSLAANPGSNVKAKQAATEAFHAHLGGATAPVAAAAVQAAVYDASKLEEAIATVLAKDYKSSGAVHYWLNSSQGANLSAEEKKAVQKAWKDWKGGAAIDPTQVGAKFAAEHAGEVIAQTTPAATPAAAGPKLASGSKAKVDAAFQNLPIVASYPSVMNTIDGLSDLTAKEKTALKGKWSVANAVSKSNMHPSMTVEEAKAFFAGLGITPTLPLYQDTMSEWGKLKGIDWKAQEKLEAKAKLEEAAKVKVETIAQIAFGEGATTGPLLDAHLAQLTTPVTQKEKAAIQKQLKVLVKEEKAKALAALEAQKAAEKAAEVAATYQKAQEFITAKATLVQVEHALKNEGKTASEVNKVKAAMRDIRKGGTAAFTKSPLMGPNTPVKMMGSPNAAAVQKYYKEKYKPAMDGLRSRAHAGLSLKASRSAEDLQLSFATKWTGGFYGPAGSTFWHEGNFYKSETEFWNAFARLTGNTGASREKLEFVLAQMNKAMNRDEFRLKEALRVQRGFSGWNGEGPEMLKALIDKGDLEAVKGKRFTSPSYMSSAVSSKDWSWGSWTLNIDCPPGMGGFPAQMVSGFQSEIEWLLPRNLTFEVREVCYGKNALGEGTAGRWNVFVDVVGKYDKDGRLMQDYALPVKDDPNAPVRSGSAYEAAAKKEAEDYVKAHPGESPVWLT